MRSSKADTERKVHAIPDINFEGETVMSRFAGLVVFQPLFQSLKLRAKLARCFAHLDGSAAYRRGTLFFLLVVQILLGFRRLRALSFMAGDPIVLRMVGLFRLPDVATLSRMLSEADDKSVEAVRHVSRDLVLDRLARQRPRVVTLDFDGTVQSTKGHAEGTAVGFNKKKRGARSYYPLLCTVAQFSQIVDLLHRSGNVHDSNGAWAFICSCVSRVRERCPKVRVEARIDSAFFQSEILSGLAKSGVEFTCSVPFQRFPPLKKIVSETKVWSRINATWSYATSDWKPDSWESGHRLILFRKRRKKQIKGPLQLDLFEPREYEFEYKVVVTNKLGAPGAILHFHNGRGSQEKLIGDCKQHAALDVVATRTSNGNQLFSLAGILAHNLTRELQMRASEPSRGTEPKRPAKWVFESLQSLRDRIILRPGRLVRPQGKLTLKISADSATQDEILNYLEKAAA